MFESARARERKRELLYPHACGSRQGMVGYGKGHGTTRDTCALHTTSLSCDTLVAFWSALEEETRLSLSRMKEEDFIERLTNRYSIFDFEGLPINSLHALLSFLFISFFVIWSCEFFLSSLTYSHAGLF